MNIQNTPAIREATRQDSLALAKLIDIAGEGIPSWLWSRNCGVGQSPLDIGQERAKRPTGGFSYSNALVTDENRRPIGMVLSYAIDAIQEDNPNTLPAPVVPFVELERQSVGTWYVNALAVFAEHQGKGVGTSLLKAAEALAMAKGYDTVSIQAYAQNIGAVRLYERLGYACAAKAPVRLHPCQPYYTGDVLLLVKSLDR